jgi:Predicted phosphohydrolases
VSNSHFKLAGSFFLACLIFLAGWAFWFEPRLLVAREAALDLPCWNPAHEGLRIALLADLHVGSPHHGLAKLREIVAQVNRAEPDVILLLGDFVIQGVKGGTYVPPEEAAAELSKLRASKGKFAVLGNHDWWLDGPRVAAALSSAGVTMLENTSTKLTINGQPLWLAGVSDYVASQPDLKSALRGIPEDQPVLLLSHNPDIFPDVPQRVSLTVAGHTHGGQVNLPFLGRLVVPSAFGERFAAGHVVENGRHLYVSTGTGTSILPVRFRVPPEWGLLTLRSLEHARESSGN